MTRDRSSLLHRAAIAAGAVCVLGLTSGLLPAGAQSDGGGSSEDRIDVLTASRDELRAELAQLEQRYATQREQVERARQAARDADAAALAAEARVEQAKADLEAARGVVASYAVEAYMRPPAADTLRVLSLSDADDAGFAHNVMEIMTEDRQQVVDQLVAQQAVVAREEAAAEAAATEARAAASAAEVQLVELDRMRAEQQELAADMDDRLDDALAEAAALAAIDQAASEALVADEVALRTQGPATPASQPVSSAGGSSAPAPPTTPSTVPPSSGGAPPTTARPAPTTTRPPATTVPSGGGVPSTGVTWAEVTNVGGIYVHTSIANNVRNLLNAATAAGFSLRGGGYRDPAAQIATRRANCGPTYYDIYEKPSSQCTPPTARPGRSMHERGLAIDFTSSGRLITTRSDPAFVWLSNNAARFGLYNLPSEPWHWSTNGS
jgi:peptidoglycan hydrolase CwlO-like protein